MLVFNAGDRERIEGEWRALLETGGFSHQSITPIGQAFNVLEASPCYAAASSRLTAILARQWSAARVCRSPTAQAGVAGQVFK